MLARSEKEVAEFLYKCPRLDDRLTKLYRKLKTKKSCYVTLNSRISGEAQEPR